MCTYRHVKSCECEYIQDFNQNGKITPACFFSKIQRAEKYWLGPNRSGNNMCQKLLRGCIVALNFLKHTQSRSILNHANPIPTWRSCACGQSSIVVAGCCRMLRAWDIPFMCLASHCPGACCSALKPWRWFFNSKILKYVQPPGKNIKAQMDRCKQLASALQNSQALKPRS